MIFRIATNTDVFLRLFLNSDPFISLSRDLPKKKHQGLTIDMMKLIIKYGETEAEKEQEETSQAEEEAEEVEEDKESISDGEITSEDTSDFSDKE